MTSNCMTHQKSWKELVPCLSEAETADMLAYQKIYECCAEDFLTHAAKVLREHPVFGNIIAQMPVEVLEARHKLLRYLQDDAILNSNWEPYINYQMEQGISYAKMGLKFTSWYEILSLARKYITPHLLEQYGGGPNFLSAFNGMNTFMDISMGIIGQGYLQEKQRIISEANNLLASAFDATAQILFVLEPAGADAYRFSSVNRTFLTKTGLASEAVLGRQLSEVLPATSLARTVQNCNEVMRQTNIVRWEETWDYPEGALSLEIALAPVCDDGVPTRLVASVHEVTERNKVLRELQKSFKEVSDYKFALDTSCILAITDQHGIITYINENFTRRSKYAVSELVGSDHRILNSSHHTKDYFRQLWETISLGKVWKGEIKNKGKDQNYYWVDMAIVPFVNEEGAPYQYLAISFDITERKRTEENILKLNDELEQNVTARTAQYQSLNKEMAAFTYSVAHDLRAPLRAVNGYAEVLLEDYGAILDLKAKGIIDNIKGNSAKMGTLIDDLLYFSRLVRKEVQKGKVNMNDLVADVLSQISRPAPIKAAMKVQKLPEVQGDYQLLFEVMMNLISNAIKYSSKKHQPAIGVVAQEDDENFIFSVTDNGAGFDADYSTKLFGVFQRLHMQEEFEGTGIGLAIVKSIIEKHGGKVWASAVIDRGAVFSFTLPKAKQG